MGGADSLNDSFIYLHDAGRAQIPIYTASQSNVEPTKYEYVCTLL